MFEGFSMDLAGRELTVEVDRTAAQASGVAFMHYSDTVMFSAATASSKPGEGIDFFPLSMKYEEELYSIGGTPGGFNERGGETSENTVLTCHVIDRPMRSLFPKDCRGDVILDNIVICVGPSCSPELTAVPGSAIATSISDILSTGPCTTTQVDLIDGEFIISPTADQKQVSDMALTAASTRRKVIVTEAGADEVPEQIMVDVIFRAHEVNQEIIRFIDAVMVECGKEKHIYENCAVPEELFAAIREIVTPQEVGEAVLTDDKQTREKNIVEITAKLEEAFAGDEGWLAVLSEAVYQYQREMVRKIILKGHERPDDRAIMEIRHLAAEVDLLPGVHGSGTFTRGQTQVLNACTLAPLPEARKLDGLDESEASKRYMHHYNFPSFSVSETRPGRGPGRREIGHGVLAERALIPILPSTEEFPYVIRTVSETMKSNGSTSQTSICASTPSLMVTDVPLKEMMVGTPYGLATRDTDDDYLALTDVQDLEDLFGDMDLKVGGTKNDITAIQMDIKIHGLTRPIIEGTIAKTRKVRVYILDNIMRPVISGPGKYLDPYAPKIKQITIGPQKIDDVVGKQGKVINEIIEETGVKTDITDDGAIGVCGADEAMIDKAIQTITGVVTDIEASIIFNDKVVRIINFGALVELAPSKDGIIHISKLSDKRVNRVEDAVDIGDEVTVKVTEIDKMGRINLIMRPSDLAENKTAARTEEK